MTEHRPRAGWTGEAAVCAGCQDWWPCPHAVAVTEPKPTPTADRPALWRHWRVMARAFLYHLRTKRMHRYCPAPAEPDDDMAWHFDFDDIRRCARPIGRLRYAATGRCRKHRTSA